MQRNRFFDNMLQFSAEKWHSCELRARTLDFGAVFVVGAILTAEYKVWIPWCRWLRCFEAYAGVAVCHGEASVADTGEHSHGLV